MDFNGIFRKYINYDDIKSHKNAWLDPSLENTFLEKTEKWSECRVKLAPALTLFRVSMY